MKICDSVYISPVPHNQRSSSVILQKFQAEISDLKLFTQSWSFWSYLKDFHVCVMLYFYAIAVCFLVCWFPFFLCNTWSGIMMELNLPHMEPSMTLFLLTTWLGYINSILNPFIYTIYNREFRKAFRKLFKTVREEKKPKT